MQKKWCWMMCVKYVCKNSCMWTWFGFVPFLLCFDYPDWLTVWLSKMVSFMQKWLARALFLRRVLLFFPQKSLFKFFVVIVNITECVIDLDIWREKNRLHRRIWHETSKMFTEAINRICRNGKRFGCKQKYKCTKY